VSTGATFINPVSFGTGDTPISQAVQVDNLLFVSGQVALDEHMQVIAPDDVQPQTRAALARIETILAEAGGTLRDVVTTQVFLTRREDFAAFNEVWVDVFGEHRPVRATLRADLMRPGLVVEILATAVVPES
jgi:2-iminobutanoate/2-iminopropanoate deaminase